MSRSSPDHEPSNDEEFDVVIVGGGAAGIGVAVALTHAGIENFVILDRHSVGSSFAAWPDETRFITPSFPTNSIGMLDLNAIAIGTSPAFSLEVEHPTGEEFASHLKGVAQFFELPIREQTDVLRVAKVGNEFRLDTPQQTLKSKHVIWAAGEFQYPRVTGFPGSELCRHTSTIDGYEELEGDEFVIIGGYESGVDAAFHLAFYEKKVKLFDKACPWQDESSDPSIALSTYSLERMRLEDFEQNVELFPNTPIASVSEVSDGYEVKAVDGRWFHTTTPPLLASGFEGSHHLVADLFEQRDDGFPKLNEHDESTAVPGLFLCGPSVRHDNHVFCFIYKYRQRFAVVAKAIATSLGLPAEELENYRKWGMYLDDLSCCGEECASC
ncbi:MAG: NAD(P)/FAD-dependent oxidoreductase [Planctomycetota bacterium]